MAESKFTRPHATNSLSANKVYQIVTDRLIERLEQGASPWRKPWRALHDYGVDCPHNLNSKKPYRGINVFLLMCADYPVPYWVTYKQAQAMGGQIRKGEKAMPVVFWKLYERRAKAGEIADKDGLLRFPVLRYYSVFNVEQCDGLAERVPVKSTIEPREHSPIEAAEITRDGYRNPPTIEHGRNSACYRPGTDSVSMPAPECFENTEEYYNVLFHELGHSTGHKSRLNRKGIAEIHTFGNREYSHEELVAEMSASMLCGVAGIDTDGMLDNSAAYLVGWIKALKGTPKLAVQAGGQAQKAADWILGKNAREGAKA